MNQQVITRRGDVYDTLAAIDRGTLTKDINNAMREGTLASINTMKKSKIVIEIVIDPDTKTDPLAMRVSGNVKLVKPASPRKAAIFYPDLATGMLSREHPHQRDIEDPDQARITQAAPATPHDPATGEIIEEGGGEARE